MKSSILYLRVSSDDQVRGTSLATQETDCRSWCQRNGYAVAEVYRDEGESAKTADRPALIAAVAHARRGIDALVVHKLDRLTRNTSDGLAIKTELRRHGCQLVSATEAAGDDPVGDMVSTVLLAVAQFDNQVRAARSRSGMAAIVQAGGWAWQAPHGYRTARVGNLPVLAPDPDTAPALTAAIRGYADGSMSFARASELIARTGLKANHAGDVFRMPVYGGLIVSKLTNGREVKAAFQGLVDAATWRQAADRAAARHPKPRQHKTAYIAVGVASCSHCGRRLRAAASRGRHGGLYDYYFCPSGHVRIRAERVHADLRAMLAQWSARSVDIRSRVIKHAGTLQAERQDARNAAERKRTQAESRLSRLVDGYADGTIDASTYQRKAAQYRAEIAAANIDSRAAQVAVDALIHGLDAIIDALSDPLALWMRLDTEARRRLVSSLSGSLTFGKHPTPAPPNENGLPVDTESPVSEMAPHDVTPSNPIEDARRIVDAFAGLLAA